LIPFELFISMAGMEPVQGDEMVTDREIALEQALVAIIGEAIASGLDVKSLMDNAAAGLLGSASYRWVGHPHVSNALQVMIDAHAQALDTMPPQ
jgi:hypothetical protein